MTQEHEVAIKPEIAFAEHDGVRLFGDLYLPKRSGTSPVLVAEVPQHACEPPTYATSNRCAPLQGTVSWAPRWVS